MMFQCGPFGAWRCNASFHFLDINGEPHDSIGSSGEAKNWPKIRRGLDGLSSPKAAALFPLESQMNLQSKADPNPR
jgi:hypothetical protein